MYRSSIVLVTFRSSCTSLLFSFLPRRTGRYLNGAGMRQVDTYFLLKLLDFSGPNVQSLTMPHSIEVPLQHYLCSVAKSFEFTTFWCLRCAVFIFKQQEDLSKEMAAYLIVCNCNRLLQPLPLEVDLFRSVVTIQVCLLCNPKILISDLVPVRDFCCCATANKTFQEVFLRRISNPQTLFPFVLSCFFRHLFNAFQKHVVSQQTRLAKHPDNALQGRIQGMGGV